MTPEDQRRRITVLVPVEIAGVPQSVTVAATVHLPAEPAGAPVLVAVPGGGYGRGYFDIELSHRPGYSQAEHHTRAGMVLVALDPPGVGESTVGDLSRWTFEDLADGVGGAVRSVLSDLRAGRLDPAVPAISTGPVIGMGHSMGGAVVTVAQDRHGLFDAVALMGWSARHTIIPTPPATAAADAGDTQARGTGGDLGAVLAGIPTFIYPFHFDDVPADVLDLDVGPGYPLRPHHVPPWGSATLPACGATMLSPGCVAPEAARIGVPVFVGVGERDVCPDPRREPEAYPAAPDITIAVVPGMAHVHNFAGTRVRMWDRLVGWIGGLRYGRPATLGR